MFSLPSQALRSKLFNQRTNDFNLYLEGVTKKFLLQILITLLHVGNNVSPYTSLLDVLPLSKRQATKDSHHGLPYIIPITKGL